MLTRPAAHFPAPVRVPNTESWNICSRAGLAYRIFLAWPEGEPPSEGWDVVYLLDGNAWFGTLVDSLRMQNRRPDVTGVGPAITVGIGYPTDTVVDVERRRYDLTPSRGARASSEDDASIGGGDAFLAFIVEELGPMIDARFGLHLPRRVVFGHSFGGLFVLHALMTRPDAFAAYAAASPSLWFDGGSMLRTAETARIPSSASVVIMAGALEQPDSRALDGAGGQAPCRMPDRAMIDNARTMAERLGARGDAGPIVRFHVFPGENHVSVVPAAISRALPFLLNRSNTSR
ncbi:putative alpha/beta superfamily hydrolase [Methylobacterium sp. PvP062]|uniref:Alpha/beta superfamily hydrolase n=1 Tax=Methylobacterium radiotolerans TaxID=31998 RepID=A0ABV2NTU7_9HYPH|nr:MULTISPECIES: alpha/beta hydrolase-fold protein [unclassified Methylobacterium]MBP2498315.1 putative alpha/beta superfamily hydrolase [Methylobacterium sp. PvP105]MBP2505699.1 putative alpha/beta superfamily hydrolase [Methylobacterium sp. PvP109]